jgi:hypothetical protein
MRQYAVIVIALVVLVGGLVARRYLAPASAPATVTRPEAQARALRSAEALAAAVTSEPRTPESLAPKVEAVEADCAALEQTGAAPACAALRGTADALLRAARNDSIGETTIADVQAAVAAVRTEASARP